MQNPFLKNMISERELARQKIYKSAITYKNYFVYMCSAKQMEICQEGSHKPLNIK